MGKLINVEDIDTYLLSYSSQEFIKWCLDDMPAAETWTPIEKGLPQQDGRYLVTMEDESVCSYDFSCDLYDLDNYDFQEYKGVKHPGWYDFSYINGYFEIAIDEIVAWRPYPEPYETED